MTTPTASPDISSPLSPPATSEAAAFPMSFAQELLWAMDRASPGSTAYNVPRTRRLVGSVDAEALRRAFETIVARHEILRTTYAFHGEQPVQVIHPPRRVELVEEDLRTVAREERERVAASRVRDLASRPFDLSTDLLLRIALFRLDDAEYVLHIDSHHIAFDGWSRDVLFRELSGLYAEYATGVRAALPELPIQYVDYAIWEREALQGPRLERLLEFWRDHLAGAEFVLDVPTDFPRPIVPSTAGVTERIILPTALIERLRALAAAHDATLYMVLLTAIGAVLHRYTGQGEILVGSPIAGRARAETEALLGYFANTIVQRASFAGNPSFGEALDRVRARALGAYDHQDIPFEKLVLEFQGGQQLNYSPLFQVVFTMLGGGEQTDGRLGDVTVKSFGADDNATKFDLTFFMAERPEGVVLTLRGRADLFAASSIARTLGHVQTLIEAAADAPNTPVSALPMLTPTERAQLSTWNHTEVAEGSPATLVSLFHEQATRFPDRTAVVSGTRSVTFGELELRANQLAHHLRACGVARDVPVGIALERSVDVIVAILGVLKAGGAYVPLLPEVPVARLAQQIEESGTNVVVTVANFAARIPESTRVVCLDRDAYALEEQPRSAPSGTIAPDALAYVLYTSGSTGVPKGVGVTHANVLHYTRAISRVLADVPEGAPGDGLRTLSDWHFGLVSSLGADLGNTCLFPALAAGATLHVLHVDLTTDPTRYARYVADAELDVVKITPNHLRALLAGATGDALAAALPRKWIVLGGEALPWDFAERLADANRCRVLNHYGPTETTVGVTTFEVTSDRATAVRALGAQTVPIGRPLANTRLAIVDASGADVPVGVPGELNIGGAGVASGYMNRPDLTDARFITTPDGTRWYRTGDRVRRLSSGDVEFLGRGDGQVKIRGYRVELSEIEHVLAAHPSVSQAAVLLRDSDESDCDAMLVAYVVRATAGSQYAAAYTGGTLAAELEAWVGDRLPEYMVPTVLLLDRMPLTPSGKLDRAALPDPKRSATPVERVAPRTPTETAIAEIWREVLKRDEVGVEDNFVTLGGHSLLAIRVLGKLSRRFGVRLPLRTLFDAPTIASLGELVDMELKLAALEAMSEADAEQILTTDRERTSRE